MKFLDWSGSGIDLNKPQEPGDNGFPDLHGVLFDSPFFSKTHAFQTNDYTNPGVFGELRTYLPGLAGWNQLPTAQISSIIEPYGPPIYQNKARIT